MLLIRVLLGLLVLAAPAIASGNDPAFQTLTFAEPHCSFSIPRAWTLKPKSKYLFEAQRSDHATLLVTAYPVGPEFRVDNPDFAILLKTKMISEGHEILSEDRTPFQDRTAYSVTMRAVISHFLVFSHMTIFVDNGFRYIIATSLKNSDPSKDPELTAAADSFQLIGGKATSAIP
jgi:hypothetical protein